MTAGRWASMLALLAAAFVSCAEPPNSNPSAPTLKPVSRQIHLMGTQCAMTAFGEDRETGFRWLERFVRILEATEAELSTWREDSLLSRLNRQPLGDAFRLDPQNCRLMGMLLDWNQETGGAFDPAVGSLIDVWGLRSGGRIPSQSEIALALAESGMDKLRFSAAECTVTRRAEARLDAGAFGKGEALDRLRRIPEGESFPWMIDLGGQIAVRGAPPNLAAWTVSLADPGDRHKALLVFEMKSGSIATSGGSERDLDVGGIRVGHILDPRTGRPAEFGGSTTVWHESALVADVLSTALHVLGPAAGVVWADRRDVAVLYLSPPPEPGKTPQRIASRAFEQRFSGIAR